MATLHGACLHVIGSVIVEFLCQWNFRPLGMIGERRRGMEGVLQWLISEETQKVMLAFEI